MKIRNPKDRSDLRIRRSDRVIEIGGGDNPHPRSNVVVDKYPDSNDHRCGDLKVLKHQQFLSADGGDLPFKDNEFDYAICCQVLEHVEDPHGFLKEQFRVAKRGFLETPSLLGEYLSPKDSHKWILHEHKGVLYLVDKKKINFTCGYDLCELVQDFLPKHSIGFKIVERTYPNLISVRMEWGNGFDFVVDPTDPEILKYFTGKWREEWAEEFFPPKTYWQELKDSAGAMWDISKSVFRSKVLKVKT